MNSRNQPDMLDDLGLRNSLKNWAASKEPPSNGREQLLAAVQQGSSSRIRKPSKIYFGWYFRFLDCFNEISFHLLYGYPLETVSLTASMAIR